MTNILIGSIIQNGEVSPMMSCSTNCTGTTSGYNCNSSAASSCDGCSGNGSGGSCSQSGSK